MRFSSKVTYRGSAPSDGHNKALQLPHVKVRETALSRVAQRDFLFIADAVLRPGASGSNLRHHEAQTALRVLAKPEKAVKAGEKADARNVLARNSAFWMSLQHTLTAENRLPGAKTLNAVRAQVWAPAAKASTT